jgi:hypothetical protein
MRKKQHIYRLAVLFLASTMLFLAGCGDAGVSNGVLRGSVYSNRSGGATTKTPEPGVSVVAQFDGDPKINRTTVTDGNGQYVFSSLPVGRYVVGFQKDGFKTITTEEGSSKAQSAIGEQVWVYVESGSTVTAADVTLTELPAEGDGTVIITLIDHLTGEKINGATVTAGTSTTTNSSNGEYVLTVSIIANDGALPDSIPYTLNAEGYEPQNGSLQGFAGQTVRYTYEMVPKMGYLEGSIEFAKYAHLYQSVNLSITVDGLAGEANYANGRFSMEVPVRTQNNQRSYTLRIKGDGLLDQVVNNIVGPVAGSVRVDVPALVPETVTVVGSVINPYTSVPAVIDSIGLEGGITGGGVVCPAGTMGTYSIDGVPTHLDLTGVTVTTYTCTEENGLWTVEYGEASTGIFNAINNGNGVHRLKTITGGGA